MDYTTDTYAVFNVSELNKIDFEQVLETSADTLRLSVDGTKTFVRWNGQTPSSVETLDSKQLYSYEQVVELLSTPEWVAQMTTG